MNAKIEWIRQRSMSGDPLMALHSEVRHNGEVRHCSAPLDCDENGEVDWKRFVEMVNAMDKAFERFVNGPEPLPPMPV